MSILLRGHHLFCLLGYRGKGYSEGFCTNMSEIYEQLRLFPETEIEVVEGPDAICRAFPTDQPSHCHNTTVYRKDREILQEIGLEIGSRARWKDICASVADGVLPNAINRLCGDCPWMPLGLCQEGIAHIRSNRELRELPI